MSHRLAGAPGVVFPEKIFRCGTMEVNPNLRSCHPEPFHLMRIILLIFFIVFSCNLGVSQQLKGRWVWENKELSGDVYFGDGTYFIKVFVKDSDIKVSESFSYYQQWGDTLVFSDISFDSTPTELGYYLIKQLKDDQLKLYDLQNKGTDRYVNVDHNEYRLTKVNVDEFYFAGGIGCVSTNRESRDYNNCLNFKSISILSTIGEIEQRLGKPYSTVDQGGTNYMIYLIPSELESPPYLAVSLNEQNNLETIQLTGEKGGDEFAFSGIRLGDYYTMVESRLGKPTGTQALDEQTQLWSYDPHQISIEIRNGLVFSIKLRRI